MQKSTDSHGNVILSKPYKGLKFHPRIPGNVEDHLRDIASFTFRADDVLLCTFPKSGTHWVYNMIQMLRSETLQYKGSPDMLDFLSLSEIEQLESPRTIQTHLTYPLIPEMARQGKVKIVHVLRNPKDTATSLFEFWKKFEKTVYKGDFDGFLDFCLSDEFGLFGGNWFSYVRDWEKAKLSNKNLSVLSLQFEDLKKNPYDAINKLVEFLQLDRPESFLRDVEKAVQFENLQKEHETEAGETTFKKHSKNKERLPIYRKGCVGDWKHHFTVAQSERFDAAYDNQIKEYGIDLRFSYE